MRPVFLSHVRPSVRRALSCPGPYGANLGRGIGLGRSGRRTPGAALAGQHEARRDEGARPAEQSAEARRVRAAQRVEGPGEEREEELERNHAPAHAPARGTERALDLGLSRFYQGLI